MVMDCEQVWSEISNYLEGEVDAGRRSAMEEHFRTCSKCVSVLAGTRNVIQLYSDERMIEVPAGFGKRLEHRLARDARSRSRGWSKWATWLIPVAALLLAAGGVQWMRSLDAAHRVRLEEAQVDKNIPPDMVVVIAAGAKEFHKPDCDVIRNKEIAHTMTAKEAIREGYVPCLRCMRKYLQPASAEHGSGGSGTEEDADLDADNRRVTGR